MCIIANVIKLYYFLAKDLFSLDACLLSSAFLLLLVLCVI